MSTPASGDKKNIVKMAYIYFQEGRWDKAIEEYKKLVALDPEDLNTHNMLGDVFVKKGSVVEAFDAYIKVSADFSARGQMDKALVVNKKIAALDGSGLSEESKKKQWLIKQTLKADSAMEQGNLTEAIEALGEVVKADPENLSAYSKLAELFEKQGKINEAIQQYLAIGSAFLKNRLFKKAQEMFQKIVQLEPGNLDARINLAQIFIKQGSESDAKKEFLSIAELAYAKNDLDKALLYANKAIEFKSIEAHYILGLIFFKKQQYSEAKSEFESLLRFKINHAGALIHLGLVLSEQGQLDKAVESIQKALKVEKDHLGALEALAEISIKKGSKAEAIKSFGELIGRYEEKGLLPKAVEVAQKIVSLDANDFAAVGHLGELLRKEGQKDKAVEAFRKASGLATKQGKSDQASVWMTRAQELSPTAAPPTPPSEAPAPPAKPSENVMDLEDEAPTPPQAPVAAPVPPAVEKTSVPEDPRDELNAQLGIADNYLKQNLVEEAIEIFQQLLEAHPDDQEIRAKLNQAYTAYVKTGDDVIGALEAEKKAKEDEERRIREEMERKSREEAAKLQAELEQKARTEAERQAQIALEQKVREEAERKVREELERKIRDEAVEKLKRESDAKLREELEQKARVEMERKIREETEKKIRNEIEQKMKAEAEQKLQQEKAQKQKTEAPAPKEKPAAPLSKLDAHSKTDSTLEESRDEFMTIAVAEIYTRQGLYAEAIKIYQRIIHAEPDNFEAKKKLADVEGLAKNKAGKSGAGTSASEAQVPPVAAAESRNKPSEEENSGGKKKSNRVGYV